MSQKITGKNLSYSSSLPPFLARLHAQAGGAAGPDPLLAAQKRSTKKRSSSEEAEDAPLVVDEHGNTVNLQLEKDGSVRETGEEPEEEAGSKNPKPDGKSENRETTEAKASIGGRKRKAGRVVGDDANTATDLERVVKTKDGIIAAKPNALGNKNLKKKAKKIKLSFDDDEG